MKKRIALFLALVLCLGLAACSGDSGTANDNAPTPAPTQEAEPTPDPEPTIQELQVGETARTDKMEVTLTSQQFTFRLGAMMTPEKYLVPDEGSMGDIYSIHTSELTEKVYLAMSFTVKNIGKTALSGFLPELVRVDYDDGYTFKTSVTDGIENGSSNGTFKFPSGSTWRDHFDLEPLSNAIDCRGMIKVPIEVQKNEDKPLKIIFTLKNEDGTSTDFAYTIR